MNRFLETLSKAETLEYLSQRCSTARVLPQTRVDYRLWSTERDEISRALEQFLGEHKNLIVRSSASAEDQEGASNAGRFLSVGGRTCIESTVEAVDRVFDSYGEQHDGEHVFVQPFLDDVDIAGVAFSHDPKTGLPYYIVEYDDVLGDTTSVTSGRFGGVKRFVHFRDSPHDENDRLAPVLALIAELNQLFGGQPLDIEFALKRETLYLLQARALKTLCQPDRKEVDELRRNLEAQSKRVASAQLDPSDIPGETTIFGLMPDWNPAELIGVRPKPLTLSLFRQLVSNRAWRVGRVDLDYACVGETPLLMSALGLPYVDVRASCASLLPQAIPFEIRDKLVSGCIRLLKENPSLHDKVEFEVVPSTYTFDIEQRLARPVFALTPAEIATVTRCLHDLTADMILDRKQQLKRSEQEVELLRQRYESGIYEEPCLISVGGLLADTELGFEAFARLGRAGFMVVAILRSLEQHGAVSPEQASLVVKSAGAVHAAFRDEFQTLSQEEFLKKYGHMRPGMFDITAMRYDERPESYFGDGGLPAKPAAEDIARGAADLAESTEAISRLLRAHAFDITPHTLVSYIRYSIKHREDTKFWISRNLSQLLKIIEILGDEAGFSREDCSFADISCFRPEDQGNGSLRDRLARSIAAGQSSYELTRKVRLPDLICDPSQCFSYYDFIPSPNFVTSNVCEGPLMCIDVEGSRDSLEGAILLIPNADPGYDWIFTRGIAGVITMYGSSNSHIAIRSTEAGIPAALGVGEVRYQELAKAQFVRLNAKNESLLVIA